MFFPRILVATFLYLGLVKAEQASSFDVPSNVAEQYGCDTDCQDAVAQGNAADLLEFGTNFDFDFYATAANFSRSKPGDILKLQPINSTELSITPGTSVYKMQYTSRDLNGSSVPATAFIAFPFAEMREPFNLVAYAHGTSGQFRGCAPSTASDLYTISLWSPLVLAGYAVVATDYAGLGNDYIPHKYCTNNVHANDIIYSVIAAQSAFPQYISKEWVSIGHSQGGSAVWKLSEHELVQDTNSGYLGGVALAPAATKIQQAVQYAMDKIQNTTDPRDYKLLITIAGVAIAVKRVFLNYDPTWLSDQVKQRLDLAAVGQYCITAMGSLATGLTLDEILTSFDISNDTYIAAFEKLVAPGQHSASKPLLVAQGLEDSVIPPIGTKSAFQDSCKLGNPVHMSLYPGLDHSAIITSASPEWLKFIADRFAHVAIGSACTQSEIQPFNLDYAEAPLDGTTL